MLPTKPQSIINVYFGSIKACKTLFIPLLPISIVWFILNTAPDLLHITSLNAAMQLGASLFLAYVLETFCLCWGICFVYAKIAKQDARYKTALKTTAKKFLQTLILLVITAVTCIIAMTALLAAVLLLFKAINYFLPIGDLAYIILFALIAIPTTLFFLFPVACCFIVSQMEILLRNAEIYSAIKKAIKISFKIESVWKISGFIVATTLLAATILTPCLALMWLSNLINSKLANSELTSVIINLPISFILASTFLPLYVTASIYFYNDLILRFETKNYSKNI
ncbi:MAG: hypothetical protein WCH10_02910 [bacterium]